MLIVRGNLTGISHVIDEFFSQNDRLWMWEGCLRMFGDSPLIGQGKNSWAVAVGEFGFEGCKRCAGDGTVLHHFKQPHNATFQLVGELGVAGIILYGFIGLLPLYQLWKNEAKFSPLVFFSLASLLLFVFVSLTYGVANYFNKFSALTVLAVFNLAFFSQLLPKERFTIELNNKVFSSLYVVLATVGLFVFVNILSLIHI